MNKEYVLQEPKKTLLLDKIKQNFNLLTVLEYTYY